MQNYPKQILSIKQQVQSLKDAGMSIPSDEEAAKYLQKVGYYRLRGYTYTFYDNTSKQYRSDTDFTKIVKIYEFDTKLSNLLFSYLSIIEVSLRVRLTESLLIYGDALILTDPTSFKNKQIYWQNNAAICSEIARSHDVFIKHNYINHDGKIPLWAAVEVLSFGTLSKIIKNLNTGNGSAFAKLSGYYKFKSKKGNMVTPSNSTLTSWIKSLVILRNTCAHNARIYNKPFNITPEIIKADKVVPQPSHSGLYELVLAMKYLRPDNSSWEDFSADLKQLLAEYDSYIKLSAINFPTDWADHLNVTA